MHTDPNHDVGKLINYFENYINDLNKDPTSNSKSNAHQQQIRTTSQNTSHLTLSIVDTPQPISTTLPPIIDEAEITPVEPDCTFSEDIYDRLTYQTIGHANSSSSRGHLSVKSTKRRCYATAQKRLHRRRAPTYIKELKAYLAHRESSVNEFVKISDVKKFSNVLVWLSNQTTSPSLIETSTPTPESLIKTDCNHADNRSPSVTTDSVIAVTQDNSQFCSDPAPKCTDGASTSKSSSRQRHAYLTYDHIGWKLKMRKEVFSPAERFDQPLLIDLLYLQVIGDVFSSVCVRISEAERTNMKTFLSSHGVATASDVHLIESSSTKKAIVEQARQWSLYFCRLFPVSMSKASLNEVQLLGVSHSGIRLIKRSQTASRRSTLQVLQTIPFDIIQRVSPIRNGCTIDLKLTRKSITIHSYRIQKIKAMIDQFLSESRTANQKHTSTPLSNPSDLFKSSSQGSLMTYSQTISELPPSTTFDAHTPKPTLPTVTLRHSMMEFALLNFKLPNKRRSKKSWKTSEWTWQDYAGLIRWSKTPIQMPLLRHSSNASLRISRQCFLAIMRYMGDYPMVRNQTSFDCLLYLLKNMHKHRILIDEVLCQVIKQLTDSASVVANSQQHGWNLLAMILNYFIPSDHLKRYFIQFLRDHQVQNEELVQHCFDHYEQTLRYGGRKTMPTRAEFDLLTANDHMGEKQQTFLLPGGIPLTILTAPSTTIDDCLTALCELLGTSNVLDSSEYSVFIISTAKHASRLLSPSEYLFDVLNECTRLNTIDFHLILKRILWSAVPFLLKNDTQSELFIDFMYYQLLSEFIDGTMLVLQNNHLSSDLMQEISLMAALQYRTSNKSGLPSMREVKYLLPATVLQLKNVYPQQWTTAVHDQLYSSVESMSLNEAKITFLNLIQTWPLFGVTLFLAQTVNAPSIRAPCFIGIHRQGLLFLDFETRETIFSIVYADLVSIRRHHQTTIDIKYGNANQLHILQCQVEKAQDLVALSGRYLNFNGRSLASAAESKSSPPQIPTPMDTHPMNTIL